MAQNQLPVACLVSKYSRQSRGGEGDRMKGGGGSDSRPVVPGAIDYCSDQQRGEPGKNVFGFFVKSES